jgi:hypothetical protein
MTLSQLTQQIVDHLQSGCLDEALRDSQELQKRMAALVADADARLALDTLQNAHMLASIQRSQCAQNLHALMRQTLYVPAAAHLSQTWQIDG